VVLGILLLALAGARLAWHAVRAEHAATAATASLTAFNGAVAVGDADTANVSLAEVQAAADRAVSETSGLLWRSFTTVPYLGRTLRTGHGLAANGRDLAQHGLPGLIDAAGTLRPETMLRPDGSLDLVPLRNAAPVLSQAAADLERGRAAIAALPGAGLLPSVADTRASFLTALDQTLPAVRNGSLAAKVAPAMLGTDGDRRYVVDLRSPTASSDASLRAYVVLDVIGGRLSIERPESPTKGQTRIDGTIDLDPAALSALLQPIGSVTVQEGSVTPDTVQEILAPQGTTAGRPKLSAAFAQELLYTTLNTAVSDPNVWSAGLLQGLGAAAGGGHLHVASLHPAEQQVLNLTSLGGH
jgi:hypothetical protein